MEMEDHHPHHHNHLHHQIHLNQYGITDLRHLISSTPSNNGGGRAPASGAGPTIPPHPHQLIPSLSPPPLPSFETLMMIGRPISAVEIMPLGLHHHQHQMFHHEHPGPAAVATTSLSGGGLDADTGVCLAGDGGTGRWPRQETLTLLEIRSRLDSKFKEANQKGPLWDEVSRIMSEEHGYQRSGKKCREKFENLYKYYKKTKEGKAGRQDGKHYRFFRQLEALYGETSNSNNNNNQVSLAHDSQNYSLMANNNLPFHAIPSSGHNLGQEGNFINNSNNSLSLSNNSSELESSSSDDNESSEKIKMRGGNRPRSRSWKAKIKEFIDAQMRKLMETQEAWLEKLMRTLEQKENERGLREEEWRRKEASRIDREHRFWAKERAWIEARDSALMEALKNLTGKEQLVLDNNNNNNNNNNSYKALHVSSSPKLGLSPNHNNNNSNDDDVDDQDGSEIGGNGNVGKGDIRRKSWSEEEVSRLIQLRTSMGPRFEQGGFSEEVLWEEIAAKMVCLGFDRSGLMCREKWESVNDEFAKKSRKKRKENSRECGTNSYGNFHNNESSASLYNHHGRFESNCDQMNDGTSSSPSDNATTHHDACFPFFMGDQGTENLWENYGLKISKGGQNN